jgi:hypothetical protein
LDVSAQIRHATAGGRGNTGYLAYFQAFTNTYGPLRRLRELYDEALGHPGVVGLCVGTRPDCVDEAVLDLLASYAGNGRMVWLELGLQSAHDATLALINRGHDFSQFVRAALAASERNLLTCVHLILGLPGEGPHEVRRTARCIAPLPLHGVKLHGLYVCVGTGMERLVERGLYRPWSQEAYVQAACDVLERIPSHWVVQRLTSDPPLGGLMAPSWALRKAETIHGIRRALEDRDTWQGRLLEASPGEAGP